MANSCILFLHCRELWIQSLESFSKFLPCASSGEEVDHWGQYSLEKSFMSAGKGKKKQNGNRGRGKGRGRGRGRGRVGEATEPICFGIFFHSFTIKFLIGGVCSLGCLWIYYCFFQFFNRVTSLHLESG